MTVFHGSYVRVTCPDVKRGRAQVDFGQGFYLTRLREQATTWAQSVARRHRDGIAVLNVFDFDDELARILAGDCREFVREAGEGGGCTEEGEDGERSAD